MNYLLDERYGRLILEDARIIFRNFSGEKRNFNREGDRNFNIILDDLDEQSINEIMDTGWNVRLPKKEGDHTLLKVNVKYGGPAPDPDIFLYKGDKVKKLSEKTVTCLDNLDIDSCDIILSGYKPKMDNPEGTIYAYLYSMRVNAVNDYFADKYSRFDENDSEENDDDYLPF